MPAYPLGKNLVDDTMCLSPSPYASLPHSSLRVHPMNLVTCCFVLASWPLHALAFRCPMNSLVASSYASTPRTGFHLLIQLCVFQLSCLHTPLSYEFPCSSLGFSPSPVPSFHCCPMNPLVAHHASLTSSVSCLLICNNKHARSTHARA